MTCQIGVVPETRHGDTRDSNEPSVAHCFTHHCRVGSGGCDKARIAELEAALRWILIAREETHPAAWEEVERACRNAQELLQR